MRSVDNVFRHIAKCNYIIVTDLVKAFYQIPLAHDSMKYCGVVIPFKGVRVYTRSAIGMFGSETHLEELMSRVLGHLIQEGCVTKIVDDLYIGSNTSDEALYDWSRILAALRHNNLRISAQKTIICPRSTVMMDVVQWYSTDQPTQDRHSVCCRATSHRPGSTLPCG